MDSEDGVIVDVDLEDPVLTEEELINLELFLEGLVDLCNKHSIVIMGCPDDCGVATIENTDTHIEKYQFVYGHIVPVYTEMVKAA